MKEQAVNGQNAVKGISPKVGVIGAEQAEIDLLLEKLSSCESFEYAGMRFYDGYIYGVPVTVSLCGVGKVNAAMCVQILAVRFGVSRIINTGTAGGADDRLSVLDMVVSSDAVFHDVDVRTFGYAPGQLPGTDSPFFAADPVMLKAAEKVFSGLGGDFFASMEDGSFSFPVKNPASSEKRFPAIVRGRIASGDVFVADKELRRKIISTFSPACVEMEGAAVAQACTANGLPFLILRSVSDMADDGAGMPHREFARRASMMSAAVVCGMLESAGDWNISPDN